MSDNLWERCGNVSTADGRSFVPNNGDGMISMMGEADVDGWPPVSGGGFRGFAVSNRQYADLSEAARHPAYGFRGVRSAKGLLVTDVSGVPLPVETTTEEETTE